MLGHSISATGILVDPVKIEIISKLPSPTKKKEVQSFLGYAKYYRRFTKDFNQIASPLYNLLKKDAEFSWTEECEKAFLNLKVTLT